MPRAEAGGPGPAPLRSSLRLSSFSAVAAGYVNSNITTDQMDAGFRALEGRASGKRAWAWAWAVCRWAGVSALHVSVGAALCWAMFMTFFGAADSLASCDSDVEEKSRAALHWVMGWLPGAARAALIGASLGMCCRKTAGLKGGGAGLARELLLGDGEGDGAADRAGWLAIVGGHPDDVAQPTWAEAREARKMTQRQAIAIAVTKLTLWHWSQPLAYLWLLFSYRCLVAELGVQQQYLASIVAAREVLYIISTVVAVVTCPIFLLLDLRTVWAEAETGVQRFVRLSMYVLTPHNFVALSSANRHRGWVRIFYCLAAVQMAADLSSCYALANLMATRIQAGVVNGTAIDEEAVVTDDPRPLEIGYSMTAFGFLLFFGPLSVATNIEVAIDKQRHRLTRLLRGVAGGLLLGAWLGIMVLMVWLIAGGNPFCSGVWPFPDPCNGHGQCFSAGLCHCEVGYGPESKLSEVDMCSCDGFCGARTHIVGAEGRLYLIEKTLPKGAH